MQRRESSGAHRSADRLIAPPGPTRGRSSRAWILALSIALAVTLTTTVACRVVEVPVQTAAEIRDVPRPTVPAGNRAGGSEPFVLIIVGTEEAAEAIRAQGQTGTLWRAGRGFDMDVHALPDAESEAFFWNAFAEAENLRCNTPCRDIVVLDLRAGRH